MRIIQIFPTFAYGDAIGNHTLSFHFQFQKRGIENEIYAEHIVERLKKYAMHEGFCVPLVEAMIFNVAVLAYIRSTIAETLGKDGIVHNLTDSIETGKLMNDILTDLEERQEIKKNQQKELKRFDEEKMTDQLLGFINKNRLLRIRNG